MCFVPLLTRKPTKPNHVLGAVARKATGTWSKPSDSHRTASQRLLRGLLGVAHRCSRELRQDDNSVG